MHSITSTEPARRSAGRPGRLDPLALFAHVWALAMLLDGVRFLLQSSLWGWPMALLSLWAAVAPRKRWPLVAAMVVQVAFVFLAFKPRWTPNHTLFIALGNIGILTGLLTSRDRKRAFRTFAAGLSWGLIIFYGFTVFHKLNWDFFDPQVSCAVSLYEDIRARFWFLPYPSSVVRSFLIWSTIFLEAAIPALLVFRPTRVFGVLLGFGFHFFLAQYPEGNLASFASMLYAVYLLFLPRSALERIAQQLEAIDRRLRATLPRWRVWAVSIAVGGGTVVFFWRSAGRVFDFMNALWDLWAAGALLLVLIALLRTRRVPDPRRESLVLSMPRTIAGWVVVISVVFVGLNPYLGLRTETSWAMFSNLRTEVRTNHFFMPRELQLAGFQRDLVRIVGSSDGELQEMAEEDLLLPYIELRRRVARLNDDAFLTYVRQGTSKRIVVGEARLAGEPIARPLPFPLDRLFQFRPVSNAPAMPCSH